MKIYNTLPILLFLFVTAVQAQQETPILQKAYNGFYAQTINDGNPSGINPDDQQQVHYSNTKLIDFKNVKKIMASKPKGYPLWSIFFKLDYLTGKELEHFTTNYKGIPSDRRDSILYEGNLVLVIQNEIVSVANITSIIKNGTFSLGQFDTKKQAKEIIKRIKQTI